MRQKIGPAISEATEKFLKENFGNLNSGAVYTLDSWPGLYARTLHDLKGKFSRGELILILDVFNGLWLNPELAGQHIQPQVEDGIDLNGLDAKWQVDKETILNKLRDLRIFSLACLEIWARAAWKNGEAEKEGGFERWVKRLLR